MAQTRFRVLLLEAIKQFQESGYTNEADLQDWLLRLHYAMEKELPTDEETRAEIASVLAQIFKRDVDRMGVTRRVPGVSKYTIDRIAPHLRAELDRRIFAAADLIKLNKKAAKEKTLQRFSGWVTSVPRNGTKKAKVREVAADVLKPTAQLKFERRRVAIDQGHKLSSSIAAIVATQNGAIAAIWHDRGEYDHGYDARPDHLKRSGKMFLIRDSWAIKEGLIKKGGLQYTDDVTQPAEEVYCSCWWEYIDTPRDLPTNIITAKGRAWLSGKAWVKNIGPRSDAVMRTQADLAALDVAPSPTPAQRSAGNYRKGHVRIAGIDVAIETPRNALRYGIDASGKPWSVPMPAHYGYFKRTEGADGDEVDCYIGPDPAAQTVWIVEQIDLSSGQFDEHKVLLGFGSRAEAVKAYELGFSDGMGPARCGNVLELTIEQFKEWLMPLTA